MGRRKVSESEEEEEEEAEVSLKPGFFVPCHPVLTLGVVYGLFLTFTSALQPSLLPPWLPLGPLAASLGEDHPTAMAALALAAAGLHLVEAVAALLVALYRHHLAPMACLLWASSVLVCGVFAFWPLLFPAAFYKAAPWYCRLPAAFCSNL